MEASRNEVNTAPRDEIIIGSRDRLFNLLKSAQIGKGTASAVPIRSLKDWALAPEVIGV